MFLESGGVTLCDDENVLGVICLTLVGSGKHVVGFFRGGGEFCYVKKSFEWKAVRGYFVGGVTPFFCVATIGVRF